MATVAPLPIPPPEIDEDDPLQNVTRITVPFCNVTLGEDLFRPEPFHASVRLERTNEIALRFGGSNDMITLLEGSDEQQSEYLMGLLGSSIVCAAFFALWCILMFLFKCTGYRRNRNGFLSGRFIRPRKPQSLAPNKELPARSNDEGIPNVLSDEAVIHYMDNSTTAAGNKSVGSGLTSMYTYLVSLVTLPFATTATHGGPNNNIGTLKETNTVDKEDDEEEVGDDSNMQQLPKSSSAKALQNQAQIQSNDDDAHAAWMEACRRQHVRLHRTRIVLCLSCLCISISGILFCVYGDQYINQSFSTVRSGLRQIQRLCQGGVYVIDRFAEREQQVTNETLAILQDLNGNLCPDVREKMCDTLNITDIGAVVGDCDFTGLPFVNRTFDKVFSFVFVSKAYVLEHLEDARKDLVNMYDSLEDFLNSQSSLEWAFWVSFGFTIALIVCCVMVMYGIYRAAQGKLSRAQEWVRQWIMFPLFCFLVVCAYAFALAFIIAAIGASDWCINSPDGKVTWVLDENQDDLDSAIYQFAKYYVNGCDSSRAPFTFADKLDQLLDFLRQLVELSAELEQAEERPDQWQATCGSDISVVRSFAETMENLTCLLSVTLEDVNRFFWCRQWNPVYVTFMHEAICLDAQSGLTWVASSMFTILVFAFVVLLLRAGAFDIEEEEEFLANSHRLRHCCGRRKDAPKPQESDKGSDHEEEGESRPQHDERADKGDPDLDPLQKTSQEAEATKNTILATTSSPTSGQGVEVQFPVSTDAQNQGAL